MAENKNEVKNVNNDLKTNSNDNQVENVNVSEAEGVIDIFAQMREREESNVTSEGQIKIYKTGIPVQYYQSTATNGTKYDNYGIGFPITVNGQKVAQVMNLIPSEKRKPLYDSLAAIMNRPGDHNLEIVRTTMTNSDTRAKSYIYSMQVSCLSDEGFEFTCPLRAASRADSAVFENLKRMLIAKGVLE